MPQPPKVVAAGNVGVFVSGCDPVELASAWLGWGQVCGGRYWLLKALALGGCCALVRMVLRFGSTGLCFL
ncbi:hypothetical protein [Mycobacteroides abscessus]|uniref:hypothetical protein n=1 Tax=Mycobacteroides abscessus TaxID=36809 RepID=UPI0011BEA0EE|nr:hypothetical protein [Mycobacteroides abscessus]